MPHHLVPQTPMTPAKTEEELPWKQLCDEWDYRWASGSRKAGLLRRVMHGLKEEPRKVYFRERVDPSKCFTVAEGHCVFYQYDRDTVAIAKVGQLLEDSDGEPCFRHSCYWTAEDMAKDKDAWELPQDAVPFHKKHELVYCGEMLQDPCCLILGRCTVRRVMESDSEAVRSAIARCDREEDSFFWRYELPHETNAERLGLVRRKRRKLAAPEGQRDEMSSTRELW